jgi:adenine/guanine phosphoribosyltransferase-like PRPP-binding protein
MTEMWQNFEPADVAEGLSGAGLYVARMPDRSGLALPLRDLGQTAVAGLIINQASFAVVDRLAAWMREIAGGLAPQVVAGLPTLGHVLAPLIARRLGHTNWVAFGTTRKLWYDEAFSVPLASITSPADGRRLWLDPRLLGRLKGRRVLLVDDVISTGASARAGLALLQAAGAASSAVIVAMAQGDRWRERWPSGTPVLAVFASPLFDRSPSGWVARVSSAPLDCCPLMRREGVSGCW